MYGLKNSFQKISEKIQIPFRISEKDGTVIVDFLQEKVFKLIRSNLKTQKEELVLETYERYSNCINLLKYCLEEELSNAIKSKEEIIKDIIRGKEFSNDILKEVIKYKPFKLILIYLKENQQKVIKSIEKKYIKEDNIIISQDNFIIIISKNDINNEDIKELYTNINKTNPECYLSYCEINEYGELKERYEYLKSNIEVCLKYKLPSKVYTKNSLLLEKMVQSTEKKEVEKLFRQYNETFSKLDDDLIKTIEIFFSEGLKISESADKLYIHRNTLFYRIDKIKKLINYDISNFNEAIEFKVLFLCWKEVKIKAKF